MKVLDFYVEWQCYNLTGLVPLQVTKIMSDSGFSHSIVDVFSMGNSDFWMLEDGSERVVEVVSGGMNVVVINSTVG